MAVSPESAKSANRSRRWTDARLSRYRDWPDSCPTCTNCLVSEVRLFNRLIVLIAVLGMASCTQGPPAAARPSDSGAPVAPDGKVRDQQAIDSDAILKLETE